MCSVTGSKERYLCECLPFGTSLRQGGADHGSTRMSIFRSISIGRSGATVLMAGILSSSPRTRLPDDRYTAFLIMPATLSNASAAAAAVPYSDCVGGKSSCLAFSLPENEIPAGDDQHRGAC